jgi:hypothetical protein
MKITETDSNNAYARKPRKFFGLVWSNNAVSVCVKVMKLDIPAFLRFTGVAKESAFV